MAKKETVKKEIVKKDELREEKMKALENALTQLNKTYGKGSVMKFSDKAADTNLQVISTGCLDLDMALGVGGLPRGRVVEIYGPESSGKTTVALHCVAEAQKAGGVAAFIDAEHALDPYMPRSWGSTSTISISPSPIPASRRWRSARRWCVPARWILWSLTPWPRWYPRPKSKAIWATASWACRPGW
mgnify:CR=1 FL=1